jgi:dUTP pyrophosphatase
MSLPSGYVGMVCPRSGLADKHGIMVVNAPGIIDAGYRGEIKVILFNSGHEVKNFKQKDRIAQLVIMKLGDLPVEEVSSLDSTERGTGGFGSTGV